MRLTMMYGCKLCGKVNVPINHRCNDPDEKPVHPTLTFDSAEKVEQVRRKAPVQPWAGLFTKL